MLPNNVQHQYWITKKSVSRKLGGKEDDCVISSDAELDAKLELFKSVNESCLQLQRVIDLYQERLCYLAQEENALGRYLKECGKNEKNSSAGQLMTTAGKALAYSGHQRLTIRPPLVRLHHEVETFRARAITDTRVTVTEMEKARTEYRAALSWMKSASNQLDPDSGYGLENFRKTQSYVKTSKTKFDRYTLACLQKVDLLAAARCNMFSHALVSYQNALNIFATKALDTFSSAVTKLEKVEPYDFNVVTELAVATPKNKKSKEITDEDKDKNSFFNAEYTDKDKTETNNLKIDNSIEEVEETISNLLGEDFSAKLVAQESSNQESKPSSELLDLDLNVKDNLSDFLGANSKFMPSTLITEESLKSPINISEEAPIENKSAVPKNSSGKTESQVSWLSLFAELDPLSNGVLENNTAGDRA